MNRRELKLCIRAIKKSIDYPENCISNLYFVLYFLENEVNRWKERKAGISNLTKEHIKKMQDGRK